MGDLLDILLTTGFWAATVRIVSPLIFGTLGELICERAGVLNLGIEGIMTVGAMSGWMWVYQGGDLWGGVLFAASMGALLLTAGAKGKRYCLPHSRVMIHQPLGGYQGQATDIEIHTREILKIRSQLNDLMALHSGQSVETIATDTERDNFMSPIEAKAYGLIDELIDSRKDDSDNKK